MHDCGKHRSRDLSRIQIDNDARMPILQLRYPLAALLIAAGCSGSPTADDPDGETTADSSLSLPDGLRIAPGAVDLGIVEIGQHGTAQVQVTNTGLLPVWLEPRTVSAGFTVDDDCGRVLRRRASCTVTVGFSPEAQGDVTGTLTIASLVQRHRVALTAGGGRRVTVALAGPGAGHITSTPAGIDCGTTCSALFTGDVTLTATAGDGSRFVSWSAPCGATADAECALPADAASATATFAAAGTQQVSVNVAGQAPGFLYVDDLDGDQPMTPCPQPCTVYVPAGHEVQLLGFTPSTFGGWTGCAVPNADPHTCDLGSVTSDVSPTVTFNRDEREVATLLPAKDVLGLAFTPDDDLLVATVDGITRMTLSGTVVWSVAVPGGARDIVTDAAGHIYGGFVFTRGLFALDSTGATLWTRNDIPRSGWRDTQFQSTVAASPDGTVIAAHLSDGAWVVDGNGVDRFTVHGVSGDGMAVAPDGTVAVGKESDQIPGIPAAARFTATGVALDDIEEVPGDFCQSWIYDASNALYTLNTSFSLATTARILPDTSVVFTDIEDEDSFGIPAGAAIAVDSLGDAVFARWLVGFGSATGLRLKVLSPAGKTVWTHDKVPEDRFDIVSDGITIDQLTTDNNRHIAVAGDWNLGTPWIQIYAMP